MQRTLAAYRASGGPGRLRDEQSFGMYIACRLNFLQAQAALENSNLGLDNALFRFRSYLRIKDTTSIVLVPPAAGIGPPRRAPRMHRTYSV